MSEDYSGSRILGIFQVLWNQKQNKNFQGKFRPTAVVAIKNEKDLSPPDTALHLTQGKESRLLPEGLCESFQGPLLIFLFPPKIPPDIKGCDKNGIKCSRNTHFSRDDTKPYFRR